MIEPRSVTFGSESQDEIQYRSARRIEAWLGVFLGLATLIAFGVSEWHALLYSTSLSSGWWEAIRFGLVATAVTLAMTGLPIGAATMASAYPNEARALMRVWFAALGFAVVAMGISVYQIGPQEVKAEAPNELRTRRQFGLHDFIWLDSDKCRSPQGEVQVRACNGFNAAMQPSGDWRPKELFAIATTVPDGPFRRVAVAAFGFLSIICAGFLGRWYVMSASQSHRVSQGEIPALGGGLQKAMESSGDIPEGVAALTPADVFSLWANNRLMPASGRSVQGGPAYDDYADTCRMNGVEPMSLTKFGTMLTALAAASNGRVIKEKSGGKIQYKGWLLAKDLQEIGGALPVAQITRRVHG